MSYSPFGALTDHFSLAGTDLILIGSTKTPIAHSRADAEDEDGNIAASTWFGAPSTMYEVECVYALKSGTLALNTLFVGDQGSKKIIRSISAATANGEWPKITAAGMIGAEIASGRKWQLSAFTLNGEKSAQPMGFSVGVGCKLTGCTYEISCDIAEQANGLGVPVAHEVTGAIGSVSADFVGLTAAPGWTLTLSGLTQTQAPSSDEPQAAYNTGSGTAEIRYAVYAAPPP